MKRPLVAGSLLLIVGIHRQILRLRANRSRPAQQSRVPFPGRWCDLLGGSPRPPEGLDGRDRTGLSVLPIHVLDQLR